MVQRLSEREAALKSTVHRLDTVLGAVRTGVLTVDAERRTVSANPAAAALLGTPELASGPQPLDSLHAAGLGRLVETIRGATEAVRGSQTLYPQGVARQVEVVVTPLGSPGEPEGWVVALEDLTQLLRAQRLAAWSEVARRIAHQIKNPLTPIRLAAERIARKSERRAADLDEAIKQGCNAIVQHVQAMQEMVDAFSRYAKFPPMNRRPVRVGELVEQVVALYQGVRPGLAVLVQDLSGGREVLLDPEQIRQALGNLVDNAVEASPSGGTVEVVARSEGSDLVLEVADQGEGITVPDPEVLFQPFFSTKGRGSGVGLALVQRIITDHGGVVRLQPNEPKGVRAVVRIPGMEP
jgi:nitrogen fixation/metabolism regulation signal transduction histidine kinase